MIPKEERRRGTKTLTEDACINPGGGDRSTARAYIFSLTGVSRGSLAVRALLADFGSHLWEWSAERRDGEKRADERRRRAKRRAAMFFLSSLAHFYTARFPLTLYTLYTHQRHHTLGHTRVLTIIDRRSRNVGNSRSRGGRWRH